MQRWWKLLALAIAGLVVTQLWIQRRQPVVSNGNAAPALELLDLTGRKVTLASLRGQVVAVNFWASWCGPCRLEIPALAETWRANHDRCFQILGVAEESGDLGQVAAAARGFGIPYPVLQDADGSVAELFKVPGYPRTYLIDTEGKVRRVFDGMVRQAELEDALKPLLPRSDRCPRA